MTREPPLSPRFRAGPPRESPPVTAAEALLWHQINTLNTRVGRLSNRLDAALKRITALETLHRTRLHGTERGGMTAAEEQQAVLEYWEEQAIADAVGMPLEAEHD